MTFSRGLARSSPTGKRAPYLPTVCKVTRRARGRRGAAPANASRAALNGCLLGLVVSVTLAGCASNAWITTRATPLTSFPVPFRPLVNEEELRPSERTMLLLRRYALTDNWQSDPCGLLIQLREVINREPTPDKVYALAELAYLGGKRLEATDPAKALELHSAAVMHAYLYLFDGRFNQQSNPYDPQFRGACDLYNGALEGAMRITHKQNGLTPGKSNTIHAANQTIEVVCVAREQLATGRLRARGVRLGL